MKPNVEIGAPLFVVCGALWLDIAFPLNVFIGAPYVAAILLSLWIPGRNSILITTLLTLLMVPIGYLWADLDTESWAGLLDRGVAVLAILASAAMILLYRSRLAKNTAEKATGSEGWDTFEILGEWRSLLAIGGLLAVIAITLVAIKETEKSFAWVSHTHEIQFNNTALLSFLQDTETGQRGYLLTGEESYLEPFNSSRNKIYDSIKNLELLTIDNFDQQKRITRLKPLVGEKLEELELTINVHREHGFSAALKIVKTNVGKHVMDQIRLIIEEISAEEERLLSKRQERTELLQVIAGIAYLLIISMVILLPILFFFRVQAYAKYRQKSEENLAAAKEKADKANSAKSEFLSSMSHEIRTPLNGVLGVTQLLQDTDLDEDQRDKINIILSSGQTLLAILNDVLDVSKIEAGGVVLEEYAFSVDGLVSTITAPFQSLADDKGIKLIVSGVQESAFAVKGDPVRLRQILWNILSNAIKFTDKGSITLTIKKCVDGEEIADLALIKNRQWFCFSVDDTGPGIKPDRIDVIFDPFTQEDNSITRKHGGTGLGLSIVKQLTELMGGTLVVDSKVGIGSKFLVYIPFEEPSKEEVEAASLRSRASAIDRSKPLKILLAEDNEVNAVIAKAFLEKFGHSVKHVENGLKAVEVAQENWADLILMDIHMPEMDGIDATKEIRSTELGRTIPIVGLTAEAFADRHALFKEAGMNGVLTKPYTEQQLDETIAANRQIERRSVERHTELQTVDYGATDASQDVAIGDNIHVSDDAEPPIGDEHKLAKFRNQLPAETVSHLLMEAQNSLRKCLKELQHGIQIEDSVIIREVAHSIKGSSGSMFAIRVSKLAAELETKSEDIEIVRSLLPGFEVAAQQSIEWWRDQSA